MPKTEKLYTELKAIKITPTQAEHWNPKQIREFLDGKLSNLDSPNNYNVLNLLKELYDIMNSKMKPISKLSDTEMKSIEQVEELIK